MFQLSTIVTCILRLSRKIEEAGSMYAAVVYNFWKLPCLASQLVGSCSANRENCWSSVATGAVRQHWPPVRPSSLNWSTKLLRSVVSRRQGLLKMVFVLEFITRIPCIYAVARLPWVCSLTRGEEAVELTRSEARERRTARAPKDSNWTKRLCPV